jgi:hypothetical protein
MPENTPRSAAPTGEDRTSEILTEHARACLEELLRSGVSRHGSVVVASGGLTVRVSVSPTPPRRHPRPAPAAGPNVALTDCERDCWELIGSLTREQRRAGAKAICAELEARGIGVYALITVKRSLARLHKELHLVSYCRKAPGGYYRADIAPLFDAAGEAPLSAAS